MLSTNPRSARVEIASGSFRKLFCTKKNSLQSEQNVLFEGAANFPFAFSGPVVEYRYGVAMAVSQLSGLFCKRALICRALLQKRPDLPDNIGSLQIVATP